MPDGVRNEQAGKIFAHARQGTPAPVVCRVNGKGQRQRRYRGCILCLRHAVPRCCSPASSRRFASHWTAALSIAFSQQPVQ